MYEIIPHDMFSHTIEFCIACFVTKNFFFLKRDSIILKIKRGCKTQYTDYRYFCERNPWHPKNPKINLPLIITKKHDSYDIQKGSE